jgi:prepilin-type N-terminal cleavage/methylation domain-containing protein
VILRPPANNADGHAGFTLIELSAVLIIMALLAAAVTISFRGKESRLRMQDVASRWRQFEEETREHARRFGRPAQMVVDLSNGKITRIDVQSQEAQTTPLELPTGFAFAEFRLGTRTVRSGEFVIPCSSQGRTPTYAVLLAGPRGQKKWWLATGLTGDIISPESQEELETTFTQLVPPRSPELTDFP